MSAAEAGERPSEAARQAAVFAALGEPTRLTLLKRLSRGESRSIAQLTGATALTRQAVTKHLAVLERAHLVRKAKTGRERRFELVPETLTGTAAYLAEVSHEWDQALARLQAAVES